MFTYKILFQRSQLISRFEIVHFRPNERRKCNFSNFRRTSCRNVEERTEEFKQKFKNEEKENNLTTQSEDETDQQNQPIKVPIQTFTSNSENPEINKLTKRANDDKISAQISAADRSMKTNLLLGSIFVADIFLSIIVPDQWKNHFYAIVFTSMK